jgi:hypothetical protein
VTESLQGSLVAKGVLSRLGDKLETGVDGLDGLLGLLLSGSHCKLRTEAKEEEQNFFILLKNKAIEIGGLESRHNSSSLDRKLPFKG